MCTYSHAHPFRSAVPVTYTRTQPVGVLDLTSDFGGAAPWITVKPAIYYICVVYVFLSFKRPPFRSRILLRMDTVIDHSNNIYQYGVDELVKKLICL